jgi:hypothetical protein
LSRQWTIEEVLKEVSPFFSCSEAAQDGVAVVVGAGTLAAAPSSFSKDRKLDGIETASSASAVCVTAFSSPLFVMLYRRIEPI